MAAVTLPASSELGARFRWVRENLKDGSITQAEAARRVGCSLSHLSKIEVGIDPCSERLAKDFCRVFGANPSWLATGQGERWGFSEAETQEITLTMSAPGFGAGGQNKHGKGEICRSLVMAAAKEAMAAVRDDGTVKVATEFGQKTGMTADDAIALMVWEKVRVKDDPPG